MEGKGREGPSASILAPCEIDVKINELHSWKFYPNLPIPERDF